MIKTLRRSSFMRLKSLGAVTLIVLLAGASFGQESVKSLQFSDEKISNASGAVDRVIAAGLAQAGLKTNDMASDEVFVRRTYLDAIGRIPSAEEAASFLASDVPDKRARLIDQLVLSDGYRSHQFNWLADMVRHKSILKWSQFHYYERWIKDQITANLPWDGLVYKLLTAEGSLASTASSGYLLRDRGVPLDSLSNTLTIFLGANVSCAHIHSILSILQRCSNELNLKKKWESLLLDLAEGTRPRVRESLTSLPGRNFIVRAKGIL